MSDPYNSEIDGYHTPSAEELTARKKRNFAIAACLFGFVTFVFVLMLYKLGVFA